MEFFRANLWEIKKSTSVRLFGLALSLGHILTFAYWSLKNQLPLQYAQSGSSMCWPYLESCDLITSFPTSVLSLIFGSYFLFSLIACFVLFSSRLIGVAWFFVFLATVLKFILYAQDYRLAMNIQFLHFLLLASWLFIPSKVLTIKFLVVSYFLTSGIQKLSPEWLIGKWFLDHGEIPVKLAEWFAALGAMIEFIAPMVLFFRDSRYFSPAFLTLSAYLAGLIYAGEFFAPSLLLLFILIFPLYIFEQHRLEREFIYQSFIRPEPNKFWAYLFVLLFILGQALPYFDNLPKPLSIYSQITKLTTKQKIQECRQFSFQIYNNRWTELEMSSTATDLDSILTCDSYLQFLKSKSQCEKFKDEKNFESMSSFFYIRGLKDVDYQPVFEIPDVCNTNFQLESKKGPHGI